MAENYQSPRELVNAIKYANLSEGEVIVKLNGELWLGRMTEITASLGINEIPHFEVKGYLAEK